MEEVSTIEERVTFLQDEYDLSKRNAQALILAELGYSASGISGELDVTEGTARKYLSRLEERIGEGVTETLPKGHRYNTFPDDDVTSGEPKVYSDVFEPSMRRVWPLEVRASLIWGQKFPGRFFEIHKGMVSGLCRKSYTSPALLCKYE